MAELGTVAGVLLVLAATFGPLLAVVVYLNRRDHQRARLLSAVGAALRLPELEGRVALDVRAARPGRPLTVVLDIGECSRDEIWNATARLGFALPAGVRVVVRGAVDRRLPASLIVEGVEPISPRMSGSRTTRPASRPSS